VNFTKFPDNGPRGNETCWKLIIENLENFALKLISRGLNSAVCNMQVDEKICDKTFKISLNYSPM
jgi:hypothetical protein